MIKTSTNSSGVTLQRELDSCRNTHSFPKAQRHWSLYGADAIRTTDGFAFGPLMMKRR